MRTPIETMRHCYAVLPGRIQAARAKFGPLTLAEKLVFGHMDALTDEDGNAIQRGLSFIDTRPDRVAMQDATAQMALLQFSQCDLPTRVPASIHADHLLQARDGVQLDLPRAVSENVAVYRFLRSAKNRYGIEYWDAGSGIIHAVLGENRSFPGGMMVGTDSHTPHSGGLCMLAIGVGGADAAEVMAGLPFNVLMPTVIGVHLTGKMNGWARPKDLIIELLRLISTKGGTNAIVEFFGPGCESIPATGRMTITNMGAEHGATSSLFPCDAKTLDYLRLTGREEWCPDAEKVMDELQADPEVQRDPWQYYDQVVEIDLNGLKAKIAGPHKPDAVRDVSAMRWATHEVPELSHAFIGSCTNSSIQDMHEAAEMIRAAEAAGLKPRVPLWLNAGSQSILDTLRGDGTLEVFEAAGVKVLANACGACIGMWDRPDKDPVATSIISSYNRNFPGRNDGRKTTLSHLASPPIVVAYAYGGRLDWDPTSEAVPDTEFRFPEPKNGAGRQLPLLMSSYGFEAPPETLMVEDLAIPEGSKRLARLEPFAPWDGQDFVQLPILVKAQGQCTTDHISPGGKWLEFRGNLAEISRNSYDGVVSPWTGKANDWLNLMSGERGSCYSVARDYQDQGIGWAVVGDTNVGEGSSREHAALQPRFLGCRVIVARSFARIHETNLKKQGILALTFVNPADYDLVVEGSSLSVTGLNWLTPGETLPATLHLPGGEIREIELKHSMSEGQIEWFKAGSCFNVVREQLNPA